MRPGMNADMVLFVGRRAVETAMLISAPILVATLLMGLIVGMFQAVTSIRDMTLGMVLKLFCVGLMLLLCGGWMMRTAVGFASEVFQHMQTLGQ